MKILETIYKLLQDSNFSGLESVYLCKHIVYMFANLKNHNINLNSNHMNVINNIISTLTDMNLPSLQLTTDDIFKYYFEHDNISVSKEYMKFYKNTKIVELIVGLADVKKEHVILDANVKINSFFDTIATKYNTTTNIYGVQTNKYIYDLHNIGKNYANNIAMNDILTEDFNFPNKFFDVIFCDFPSGVHNIIHATCCNKIKKLKLRGTKFEPLLLQLFTMSLNKNGKALLIVPDSLLFSDSVQFIETRKYLLENFNVKKIIELNINNNKSSILYFENTSAKTAVSISMYNNNVEEHIMTLDLERIKNNNYSLWYKHYNDVKPVNMMVEYKKCSELLDIHLDYFNIKKSNMLALKKNYVDNNSIILCNNNIKDYDIYIMDKQNVTDANIFNLYYLEYSINKSYELFTTGKMNKFDISKINNYSIPNISNNKKLAIINYINISNNIITENIRMIEHYNMLKNNLLELVQSDTILSIEKLCMLTTNNHNNIIGVIRNGMTAGTVYLVSKDTMLSNNSYYLQVNDNSMYHYIYHMLKFNEHKLKLIANLPAQPNLNKSSLLSFEIPSIDNDMMNNITNMCNDFDNNINKYLQANDNIKSRDIFHTVLKLYNL